MVEAALSDEERELSDEQIHFALRWVADALERPTLAPGEYATGRERLVEADRRSSTGGLLGELMPTEGQIITSAGGWDAALRIAGLAVRQSSKQKRDAGLRRGAKHYGRNRRPDWPTINAIQGAFPGTEFLKVLE